jgi:tetratricopeptide (TPR) repeat protein
VGELRLEASEFRDLTSWRWALTGPGGSLVADHEARLDAGCWQFEAFGDLLGYLRWHAAPDRRLEDEARIVAEVGRWIGEEVLGPVAAALVKSRPATVRVIVPSEPREARSLLFRPLELAHVDGKPLSLQGVTLVMQLSGNDQADVPPVRDRLRVLGLFSLPEGGQPLNLRQERYALVRLLDGIAAEGRAVDVRVLQYGVTRDRLRDVLKEDEGWDVIHISGHGAPGVLLLEKPDGSPELVTAEELADVLDLARERVKLVTISACWSAGLTAVEQRRLLGLPEPRSAPPDDAAGAEDSQTDRAGSPNHAGTADAGADADAAAGAGTGSAADAAGVKGSPARAQDAGFASGTLATELVGRLGCAVLAMRYPVIDDFAIGLAEKLYDLLASKGRPLPRALGIALGEVVAVPPTPACPALSAGTPALFGATAADLRLAAPRRTQAESYDIGPLKMAGCPPQPERFVGRTGVMARASAALADASGVPGVLLHGMPGGGKTACALELAYTHEHAFDRVVWFKAPDEGLDITGALTDFALTLERELPGFQMVHLLADAAKLAAFLPKLTELVERRRVLIVIDNIESLLTESGRWRDARWGRVAGALCAHAGHGRVVLTSRRLPASVAVRAAANRITTGAGPERGATGADEDVAAAAQVPAAGVNRDATGAEPEVLDTAIRALRIEAVDALSLDEALLLARELPNLRALIEGELPGVDSDVARNLALGVLNIAQGHPKLLELADGQAADPARVGALVEAGDQAWQQAGGVPDGFFVTGESQATGADYLQVLGAWTQAVSDGLTPGQRTLFWYLCCLEEGDRIRSVADANWGGLWTRLKLGGQPPDLDEAMKVLTLQGLVSVQPEPDDDTESYGIHPGVAAAGRARAGKVFQEAVDTGLAAYWSAVADKALEREAEGRTTRLVVRAGLAGAPYLIRRKEWAAAGSLLEDAFGRDRSRATAAAVIPALQVIAATGQLPEAAGVLATVLRLFDPAAAERELRTFMNGALDRDDYWQASGSAAYLVENYLATGRLAEALRLVDEMKEYTLRAGLGPWTQLFDQVVRLKVLALMGHFEEVLAEVRRLRDHMQTLPAASGQPENGPPWNVREILLGTGRSAANHLGRWSEALELNAAIADSLQNRDAPAIDIADCRFNDYRPLISLNRNDEALELLLECRQTFENSRDILKLGLVLGALAAVEDNRSHGDVAINLQRDGLRYSYLAGDMLNIATGYRNLGNYIGRHARQPTGALALHLASALIRALAGAGEIDDSVRAAASDLLALGGNPLALANVADLYTQVAQVETSDLGQLVTALSVDPQIIELTFQELLTRVRALAATPPVTVARELAAWDPVIAALLAADGGDTQATVVLDTELDRHQDSADWGALVAALRRLRAGETGPGLLTGLDEIDTAIVTRARGVYEGDASPPADLWRAMEFRWSFGALVAGAAGFSDAAGQARRGLEAMAENSDLSPLATILGRILDGDRDPGLAEQLDDPVHRAVVVTVLQHIGPG